MLPHDFMAPNRGEDANTASAIATAAAAKRAAAARSPTTHPSQIPDAFRYAPTHLRHITYVLIAHPAMSAQHVYLCRILQK